MTHTIQVTGEPPKATLPILFEGIGHRGEDVMFLQCLQGIPQATCFIAWHHSDRHVRVVPPPGN